MLEKKEIILIHFNHIEDLVALAKKLLQWDPLSEDATKVDELKLTCLSHIMTQIRIHEERISHRVQSSN